MWFNGSYTAPLRAVSGGQRAHTHFAQVMVDGRSETAYVKSFSAGSDQLLFNEVVGGWLAQVSGIGAPPGGLLWVPESALQAVFPGTAFSVANGMVASYACAPVGNGYGVAALGLGIAIEQSVAAAQMLNAAQQHLLDWPGFPACVAFDAWVANVDRHLNNLLLAAGGRLVPIDHSDCFGGPATLDPDFVAPHAAHLNKLLDLVFPQADLLPLPIKARLVMSAEQWPDVRRQCDADLRQLTRWLGEQRGRNWLEWLTIRADITAQLLRDRVRMLA
ncbi:MAG: hypothetical protein RLY71_4594 [Pseudomonadota bacterium]|jgi:hypothetical protein